MMSTYPVPAGFTPLALVTTAELRALVTIPAWRDLANNASEPNPFLEHWFVNPSLQHLKLPADIHFALLVGSAGRIDGLMPVSIASRYGRMPLSHVQNHMHHNVFLGTPLVREGYEKAFWDGLFQRLDEAKWSKGLLCLTDLVEGGPIVTALDYVAEKWGRSCDTVHRAERAFLQSDLDAESYYAATVRKKKRKEIKRLQSRLAELGDIKCETLSIPVDIDAWCDAFLHLEKAGWKGQSGSPLGGTAASELFFRETIRQGMFAGRVELLKYSLDDRPLAMLVNFMTLPGSFSFKIAYDEEFARFSPGILIQLENLKLLERDKFSWMDSCAAEDHPMINSLWAERRTMVWKVLPLSGFKHSMTFKVARAIENGWAALKNMRAPKPSNANDNRIENDD
jgi:CelD/BcsL family acetyltransferase involved in cellulose biosynthesis